MPQLLLGDLDLLADPYAALVGSSWGEWVAITTTTDSLFLDGSVVSGEQSGNRTIALQVLVQSDVRPTMVQACEALFAQANLAANTLTFVPDDGLPVVYDVFRAQPERTDDQSEAWGYRTYTFTFPALPFARSQNRATPSALAPALVVDDFNSTTAGLLLASMPPINYNLVYSNNAGSVTTNWAVPIANSAVAPVVADQARGGAFVAVSNCTVGAGSINNSAKATASAAGTMEVRSAASWATSADVITGAVKACIGGRSLIARVGVEWLDSTGTTISTDWGPDRLISSTSAVTLGSWPDVWSAAMRPAAATQFRIRVQADAVANGDTLDVGLFAGWPSVTVAPAPTAGVGVGGSAAFRSVPDGRPATTPAVAFATFIRRVLATRLDVSGVQNPQVSAQLRATTGATLATGGPAVVSLRLYDSAGRWSRFDLTGTAVASQWVTIMAALTSPTHVSPAGACNLADIVAHDISVLGTGANGQYWDLDQLVVNAAFTGTTSPRGTVFNLGINGSARSTARVGLSSATPLTDFLVAAVSADESPMLRVTTNVATAPAPAGYDGVYSVIGALSPATAVSSPSCVVAQLVNGTQVASQTLTGLQATGNHYVDFGQIALPLVAVPDENVSVSYTFTLSPSSTAWGEVLVLNAAAPLTWVQNLTTSRAYAWIDEPVLPAQVGRIYVGSAADRSDARGVLNPPIQSRPFQVAAPTTRLLVYSTTTAPNVTLDYYPRWLVEPTS